VNDKPAGMIKVEPNGIVNALSLVTTYEGEFNVQMLLPGSVSVAIRLSGLGLENQLGLERSSTP